MRRSSVSGRSAPRVADEPQPDRDRQREDQLRPPAQPQRPPLDELRVVVGEPQQRARHRDAEDADRAPVEVGQQQERDRDRGEDDDPAHRRRARLGVMALGPVLADVLTELALAQERDELRRQEDADQQRGGARDQDLTHGQRLRDRLQADPARRLDQHDVARRASEATSDGGLGGVGDHVRLAAEAAGIPPTAARRRPARPRRRRAAYAPIARCASSSPRPSSSMSPSTATRRPPRAPAWRDRRARRAWRAGWRCSSR